MKEKCDFHKEFEDSFFTEDKHCYICGLCRGIEKNIKDVILTLACKAEQLEDVVYCLRTEKELMKDEIDILKNKVDTLEFECRVGSYGGYK